MANSNETVENIIEGLVRFFNNSLDNRLDELEFKYRYKNYRVPLFKSPDDRVMVRDDIRKFVKRVVGVDEVDLSNMPNIIIVTISVHRTFLRDGNFWVNEIMEDCRKVLKRAMPENVPFEVRYRNSNIL